MKIAHLDLTVTDVDASAAWYTTVFGLRRIRRANLGSRTLIALIDDTTGLIIGLNQHHQSPGGRFDERRPGLDHVGIAVDERRDLDTLEARLTELNVPHSPVQDTPAGSAALVFRDPDNIQLEFWWPHPAQP